MSTATGDHTGQHVFWHTPTGHDTITSAGLSATGWAYATSPYSGDACIYTTVVKTGAGAATLTVAAPYLVSTTGTGYALVTPFIESSHSRFPLTAKNGGSAIDLTYATATPTTVTYAHLENQTTPIPPAPLGANGAKAGQWKLAVGKNTGQGWVKGDTIYVYVGASNKSSTDLGCTDTNYLTFSKTPKVTAVTTYGTLSTPLTKTSFTVSVTHTAATTDCNVSQNEVMVITMKTTEKFIGVAGAEIYITTIAYNVGATDETGPITVESFWTTSTGTYIRTVTVDTAANAIVSAAYVTVTPVVNLKPASVDQTVGTVTLNTTGPTIAPTATPTSDLPPYVCIYMSSGLFNTTASAKASAKGTGAKVTPTVHYFQIEKSGLAYGVSFKITNDGTTGPQAFSVSGLKVNATPEGGAAVVVEVDYAWTSTCSDTSGAGGPTDAEAIFYTTSPTPAKVIAGATADGTAAAALNTAFAPSGCPMVVKGTTSTLLNYAGIVQRNVVLARDTFFSDALASQYLAGFLGTGTLLTPKTHLSTVTLNAIKNAGISHVYVIGGSFAVSTTVVAQLQTTEVYNCGGTAVQKNIVGQPVFLQVTRIAGPTAAGTAQMIAQFAGRNYVGSLQIQGAYRPNATNKTGGSGFFNLTAGKGSTSPSTYLPLRTAIVSTTHSWQDAESAAVLSYTGNLSCQTDTVKPNSILLGGCTNGFPMLLSTPTSLPAATKAAIQNLAIQQVIVMGGPYAVSNTVVTALEGLGVSVVRIAGLTYTSTAVELAKFEEATNTFLGGFYGLNWQRQEYSDEGGTIGVARGDFYTDGLTGADVAYNDGTPFPIVLTVNPTTLGSVLTAFLKGAGLSGTGVNGTHHHRVGTVVIFGGQLAVTPTVITEITSDLL